MFPLTNLHKYLFSEIPTIFICSSLIQQSHDVVSRKIPVAKTYINTYQILWKNHSVTSFTIVVQLQINCYHVNVLFVFTTPNLKKDEATYKTN